ncbi:MAG: LamG domain-containing protein, partial [Planctomycetaceae bacterium]|jgi:hypothetical protein|nr:LamG domain-containing protein [Planctomycetaceae bacterium]
VESKPSSYGLIAYLPFDGSTENKVTESDIKPENKGATFEQNGGKKNGYLVVRPSESPQFVTLGIPDSLKKKDLSVAFWVRMPEPQKGDPVLLGNKNWEDGKNAGVSLFVTPESMNKGNNVSLNVADVMKQRIDVKQFNVAPNEWWFCAMTVNRSGNAAVYVGSPDGKLFFGSESLIGEDLGKPGPTLEDITSTLPLNIGQDGTGTYKNQLNADIDELRIWDRALTREEVKVLFADAATRSE